MTASSPDPLRAVVIDALTAVAPDVDASSLDATLPFREQFDFDSMDHLNFVIELHRRLHVDVPEADYPKLTSLDACLRYFASAAHAKS